MLRFSNFQYSSAQNDRINTCSLTASIYVLPSEWQTKSRIHVKQQTTLYFQIVVIFSGF
jgi:hypothetical protein